MRSCSWVQTGKHVSNLLKSPWHADAEEQMCKVVGSGHQ